MGRGWRAETREWGRTLLLTVVLSLALRVAVVEKNAKSNGTTAVAKAYLEGLTALHDGVRIFGDGTPRSEHPVIIRHPESGRKSLYFSPSAVRWLNGVPRTEGKGLAKFLKEHCRSPEFFFRFRWEPHSIAFWDNRCCHHYAINDYLPQVRSGYRVQIEGHAPPTPA